MLAMLLRIESVPLAAAAAAAVTFGRQLLGWGERVEHSALVTPPVVRAPMPSSIYIQHRNDHVRCVCYATHGKLAPTRCRPKMGYVQYKRAVNLQYAAHIGATQIHGHRRRPCAVRSERRGNLRATTLKWTAIGYLQSLNAICLSDRIQSVSCPFHANTSSAELVTVSKIVVFVCVCVGSEGLTDGANDGSHIVF